MNRCCQEVTHGPVCVLACADHHAHTRRQIYQRTTRAQADGRGTEYPVLSLEGVATGPADHIHSGADHVTSADDQPVQCGVAAHLDMDVTSY